MPWIIGVLFFFLYPMAYAAYISLTDWRVTGLSPWVGLMNYQRLFKDPLFYHSLKLTTAYTLISVPLQLVFGFSMAFLLNQKIKGLSVFRTIYYMPAVLSGPAIAIVWRWLFNTEYGIINDILLNLGLINENIPWLTSRDTVFWFYIIMSLWMVGFTVVLYLAGLQSIPTEYYEAAQVDGAGRWARTWHITLPLLRPAMLLVAVTSLTDSFQVFTPVWLLTRGGPAGASRMLTIYIYENAFVYLKMGYATAIATLMVITLVFISRLQIRIWETNY